MLNYSLQTKQMSNSALFKLVHLPENDSEVSISIRVGMSQAGMITFNESGKKVIQQPGKLEYTAKSSNALDGKTFDFNVVCSDVNPSSNKLLVTVDLEGVKNNSPWTLHREVKDGGTFQFFGTVEFYK